MLDRRFQVRLTPEEFAKLEGAAAHYGTSNSDMIRRLIMIAHQRMAAQAAQPKAEAQTPA